MTPLYFNLKISGRIISIFSSTGTRTSKTLWWRRWQFRTIIWLTWYNIKTTLQSDILPFFYIFFCCLVQTDETLNEIGYAILWETFVYLFKFYCRSYYKFVVLISWLPILINPDHLRHATLWKIYLYLEISSIQFDHYIPLSHWTRFENEGMVTMT